MPDITLTDTVKATANIKLSDNAALAKSGLQNLTFQSIPLVGELDKPVDQCTFKSGTFGVKVTSPGELAIRSAATGSLSLFNHSQEALFESDEFAPAIPISSGEAWIQLELDASVDAKPSVSAGGFGVAVEALSAVGLSTYTRLSTSSGALPSLREAIGIGLENYSVLKAAASIRSQRTGTVTASELSGTVTLSGSYSLPISVAPLASANLPFNHTISVQPSPTLEITGAIALTGDFIVRCHKVSDTNVQFGVYKKRGTALSVGFEAAAGLQAGTGNKTDILSAFFGAVSPGIDVKKAGLTGDDAQDVQAALKSCLDHSLGIALNTTCTASRADESAVVYSIDLAGGDAQQTNSALASALRGDWTQLDKLPNAKPIRNIVRQSHGVKNQIVINLLGVYNAGTVAEFVKSSTVLHDENGQISVLDKIEAKRIAVAGTPYLADADRLRAALAECFLATFTYAAGSRVQGVIRQNYTRYKANMPALEAHHQMLLAQALNLPVDTDWNSILSSHPSFDHARFSIICEYDLNGIMRVFFADPATRIPYIRSVLEITGRKAKAALLDPDEPGGQARLTALNDDSIWTAMNKTGNTAVFGTIAGLGTYKQTEIQAIAADWIDITWWTDAMVKVAPKLSDVLTAVEASNSTDPSANSDLTKKRAALSDVLGAVARRSQSAFSDGWGLAVLFALSAGAPNVSMNYAWAGKAQHVESAKQFQPVRAAGS